MPDLKILTTNTYRVLEYMYEHKDKQNNVVVTQKEISNELGLDKATVNGMIKVLREKGYITQNDEHVGRYGLTEIGARTVSLFKKSERV